MTEPARGRRVGLFGGSFDPIHEGHLHAARSAQRAFRLDRVIFMPAYRSPFKPGLEPASPEHRLAMVELATAGHPGWSVSTLELERGGASYTIDTVRALRKAIAEPAATEVFLILGSDNVPGLSGWRDVDELFELVQPVIVQREGDPDALLAAARGELTEEHARKLAAGFLRLAPVEASSSALRDELARSAPRDEDTARSAARDEDTARRAQRDAGEDAGLAGVRERVPGPVLDYIRRHGLYPRS